jgi:ketosteroid isomerase-like protein
MIAEDDRVVVRNHWTATDSQTGKKLEFRGIVIWRIAARQIVERRGYLEAPHAPAAGLMTTSCAGDAHFRRRHH